MFILLDYIRYRFQLGRYCIDNKRKRYPINLSWEGSYEPVLEELLTHGDLLFFADDNSTISWLVRYFTKTDISHTGIYLGDGKVLHATLSGSRTDHLSTFFGEGKHVIPVIMPKNGITPSQPDLSKFVGRPYPFKSVLIRGACYLIGVPWRKFRLTYVFDIMLLMSAITLTAFGSGFVFPLAVLFVPYIILITLSFLNRDKINRPISDPGEGFYNLPCDAEFIPNVKKVNEKWFIDKLTKSGSHENRCN